MLTICALDGTITPQPLRLGLLSRSCTTTARPSTAMASLSEKPATVSEMMATPLASEVYLIAVHGSAPFSNL